MLRGLCGSFQYGHMHPNCLPDKSGRFCLDGDGAHWIGAFDPHHTPDPKRDFPEGGSYPSMAVWPPKGII